jgi:hypothetical protein
MLLAWPHTAATTLVFPSHVPVMPEPLSLVPVPVPPP